MYSQSTTPHLPRISQQGILTGHVHWRTSTNMESLAPLNWMESETVSQTLKSKEYFKYQHILIFDHECSRWPNHSTLHHQGFGSHYWRKEPSEISRSGGFVQTVYFFIQHDGGGADEWILGWNWYADSRSGPQRNSNNYLNTLVV